MRLAGGTEPVTDGHHAHVERRLYEEGTQTQGRRPNNERTASNRGRSTFTAHLYRSHYNLALLACCKSLQLQPAGVNRDASQNTRVHRSGWS
uniref:Uncharacterized protein n=1 Tax=Setaria italica TaxID=4555 RepID=K3ZYH6_SETIT